jgi:hypothetical protein
MIEPVTSKLVSLIQDAFPDLNIVPLQRKYFNDGNGVPCYAAPLGRMIDCERILSYGALRNGPPDWATNPTVCSKVLCYYCSRGASEVIQDVFSFLGFRTWLLGM